MPVSERAKSLALPEYAVHRAHTRDVRGRLLKLPDRLRWRSRGVVSWDSSPSMGSSCSPSRPRRVTRFLTRSPVCGRMKVACRICKASVPRACGSCSTAVAHARSPEVVAIGHHAGRRVRHPNGVRTKSALMLIVRQQDTGRWVGVDTLPRAGTLMCNLESYTGEGLTGAGGRRRREDRLCFPGFLARYQACGLALGSMPEQD